MTTAAAQAPAPGKLEFKDDYTPAEAERVIRNSKGLPVGVRPKMVWTWKKALLWAAIAIVCACGWAILAVSPWAVFSIGMTIPIALIMGCYQRFLRPGRVIETTLLGFVLLVIGIIIANPSVKVPDLTELASTSTGPTFSGNPFPFLFITIACGALSGFHGAVSSGLTPKAVEKENQIRMIGYGSMLVESFTAVIALIAAITISQGVYFSTNMSAAQITAASGVSISATSTPGEQADAAVKAVESMKVSDIEGNQMQVTWDSVDENGAAKTHEGAAALEQAAADIGETSIVSRTGGATTFAMGMANFLKSYLGGHDSMAFWYHFAIMFEALFILTTALWGGLLWMGVSDANGGINAMVPIFGISNQLLAAACFVLITVCVAKMGYWKHLWIPVVPLVWDIAVTFTADFQKIFGPLSYFTTASKNQAQIDSGELAGEALTNAKAALSNAYLDGVLSVFFLVMMGVFVVVGIVVVARTFAAGKYGAETTPEEPFVESQWFVPSSLVATALEKKVQREYSAKLHELVRNGQAAA